MKKIIFLGISLYLLDRVIAKNSNPKVFYIKNTGNYNAMTIPPVGIYINEKEKDNKILLNHELYHWKQYKESGAIVYYAKYVLENILFGYDNMPMEIEAREFVGENEYCIKNYTKCVRNGEAKTVKNTNFRK
jgi:hypothetical protein